MDLAAVDKPIFYFIGMTTGISSIMKVFPKWTEHLRPGDVVIKEIDCMRHDDPDVYRTVVDFIKGWTCVNAEVFHIDIPASGPGFEALSRIAAAAR